MTRRQRRLALIGAALGVLALAVALVLGALRDSIVFFNSPTDVVEKQVKPGMRMPLHGHCGSELAVVLSGAYEDELGRFARGDLADHGEEVTHQPRSDLREGCVCLIATDRPLRFSTPLLRLVQPMLGI